MTTGDKSPTSHPVRARWRRAFSVRALMLVVLLAGLPTGWYARVVAGRRGAIATIRAAGGSIYYRDQNNSASGFWVGIYRRTAWELAREVYSLQLDKPSTRVRRVSEPPIVDPIAPPSPDEVNAAIGRLGHVEEVWIDAGPIRPTLCDALAAAGVVTLRVQAADGSALDESLADLGRVPSLRELMIRRERRTVLPPATLRWVGAITQLRQFALEGAVGPIRAPFEADATTFARLTKLENLMLVQGPADGALLDGLGAGHQLRSLIARATRPTDAQLRRLVERAPGLERLGLDGSLLTDAGTEALGRLTRLKELWLYGRPGVAPTITDATLATVGRLDALQTLVLSCGRFTDRGLAALHRSPRLESIDLGWFGSASNEALTRLLAGRTLKALGLRGPGITDEALPAILAEAGSGTDLLLADSGVTDAGMASLAASPVARLDLAGTGITDAGLMSLTKSAVRRVDARGTRVTLEGVKAFRRALGRVTVLIGPLRPEDE